jgi:hypothetical protein
LMVIACLTIKLSRHFAAPHSGYTASRYGYLL